MRWNNGAINWEIMFTRTIQDWELELLQPFIALLYSTKTNRDGEDRMCWIPTRGSIF